MRAGIIGKEAYVKGRIGAWIGITGNVLLSLIKFMAGILGHSSAMVADAIHSLSDILSSIIVLIGLKLAQRRPDTEHPYGHSKAESISAQILAVFLIFLGGMIFLNSWKQIRLHDYVTPSRYVLLVAAASIVIKEGLFQYKSRLGKRIHSSALIADAWHHRSDAFSSIAVLVGVLLAIVGGPKFHAADHIAAMLVALIICFTGLLLLRKTSRELMDQVITGLPMEEIKAVAASVREVKAVEKLFARKSGVELVVDIHVEVDPNLSVVQGHDIAKKVRSELMEKISSLNNVMVHIEPYLTESADQDT